MITTAPTLEIIRAKGRKPLYCHYRGQNDPQPARLRLCCKSGTLLADYNPEVGPAMPADQWQGHTMVWSVPSDIGCRKLNQIMAATRPLAQRVLAGYASFWDGHNHIATYTGDGDAAAAQIACTVRDMAYDMAR